MYADPSRSRALPASAAVYAVAGVRDRIRNAARADVEAALELMRDDFVGVFRASRWAHLRRRTGSATNGRGWGTSTTTSDSRWESGGWESAGGWGTNSTTDGGWESASTTTMSGGGWESGGWGTDTTTTSGGGRRRKSGQGRRPVIGPRDSIHTKGGKNLFNNLNDDGCLNSDRKQHNEFIQEEDRLRVLEACGAFVDFLWGESGGSIGEALPGKLLEVLGEEGPPEGADVARVDVRKEGGERAFQEAEAFALKDDANVFARAVMARKGIRWRQWSGSWWVQNALWWAKGGKAGVIGLEFYWDSCMSDETADKTAGRDFFWWSGCRRVNDTVASGSLALRKASRGRTGSVTTSLEGARECAQGMETALQAVESVGVVVVPPVLKDLRTREVDGGPNFDRRTEPVMPPSLLNAAGRFTVYYIDPVAHRISERAWWQGTVGTYMSRRQRMDVFGGSGEGCIKGAAPRAVAEHIVDAPGLTPEGKGGTDEGKHGEGGEDEFGSMKAKEQGAR
ncbi:hypothetical protein B0H16DRAFT_1460714 [Mycena metata]|uniref:Uncharacterized protein n=1 Tax=Mycena metata TaxID=1033252 RepID=A0AAD7IUB7_9AGAR|nr:hypothetical protein B0H16DRAFT_1460714 [Mycena metata]